jgi:5-enolpyruvylshikimate-3-phosphate synthase
MEGKEVSRSYVETTLESMESAGLRFRRTDSAIEVEPGPVRTQEIAIPGDFSSAVSLAGSVAVRGGELDLENLEWPSRQADFAAFPVLEKMGVSIAPAGRSIRVSGRARSAVSVEASGFPDAVPVLCAVASRIPGESAFSGIEHLRLKESDRIEAIREMLAADGVVSLAGEGEIRIRGSAGAALPAPVFPTRSDHRIAMASALLCLERGGFVENPRAVEKSYPGFFRDLFRGILQ